MSEQKLVGDNDQYSAVKMSSNVVPSSGCAGMKSQSGGSKHHKKSNKKRSQKKRSQKKRASRKQRGGYGAQGFGGNGVPRYGYVSGEDVAPFAGSYPPMTAGSTGECPDAAKGAVPEVQKQGEGEKQVGGGRKHRRGRRTHNRKRSRHQKRGRRSRTARKSRRNRRQRGGYHQYLSNSGNSAGYTFSGKNPVGMQAERVRYMTSDGQDNYNHFSGKSKASPVLDAAN